MTSQGKWLGLASICVVATLGLCLCAPAANASETRLPTPSSGLDMTPTGALGKTAPASSSVQTTAEDDRAAASALLRTDENAAPFQPELPPDDVNEPPAAPALTVADPPPGESPALRQARGADAPAQPNELMSGTASASDIEAAVEAMLNADVKAATAGARQARIARIAVGVFYFKRGFAPLWTTGSGLAPHARTALGRLLRAREDGLDLSAYALPAADGKMGAPAQRAEADVTLSEAIVAYALQASGGRIEPTAISPEITAKPDVADPSKALALIAAASDPDAALEDFNPPQKAYRDLRDKLAELRAENAPVATIPAGPQLRIGMVDPRVPLIRARFGLDALAEAQGADALVYDARVAALVADFQRANGLPPSGVLTASTAQALSGGETSRQEAAIIANMEMWRWEPRDMGEERVEVNVADYSLKVSKGEEVLHRARVIVGKPTTPTAIFSNQIKYLLVNPAWNVPVSIIKKEMLPKLALDPDYLTRAGFEVTQKGDTLTVRQPPGEHNALGHLLFMFPNEHAIYLHDTPGRSLFAPERRAFSHGCVRVDDPMRLGELLMGGPGSGWTQARLRALVGDKERTIFLPHPIAIHIEYFTAFVDDSGVLQMRDDVYGHMRRVEAALGFRVQG